MLNNSINNKIINNLKLQSCSGGIYKSHDTSWFRRFHLNSELAKTILSEEPHFITNNFNRDIVDVVVLQMIICGDMEVIAEIVRKEDYENLK